jgi:hypothetical protein
LRVTAARRYRYRIQTYAVAITIEAITTAGPYLKNWTKLIGYIQLGRPFGDHDVRRGANNGQVPPPRHAPSASDHQSASAAPEGPSLAATTSDAARRDNAFIDSMPASRLADSATVGRPG